MPLKVAFIVPYPTGVSPGQRFRFEQWLQLLPPGCVDATVHPLFDSKTYAGLYSAGRVGSKALATTKGLVRRIRDAATARKADVVFLYRESFALGPPLLDTFLERNVPVVYDFDDAIFLGATSDANSVIARLKMPHKVSTIVSGATITTVGNEFLASYARRFSDSVRVLPTTIDTAKYHRSGKKETGSLIRVGWSGSRTTSAHLRTIEDVLRRALDEFPVELHIIGDPDFRLPVSERVKICAWDPESEIRDLLAFDIGLMPLPDDDWSRGKCGLKALQYMALEVPPIVSPVGVNTEIVSHGANGFVANTPDEWVAAIGRLVDDESLRRRFGHASRRTVVESYSGQRWARVFLETLREAADSRN